MACGELRDPVGRCIENRTLHHNKCLGTAPDNARKRLIKIRRSLYIESLKVHA